MRAQLHAMTQGVVSSAEAAGVRRWAEEVLPPARRAARQFSALQRREVENELVAAGVRPDGRRRYAVHKVVAWRGSGKGREALVQWRGFGPEESTWEPVSWLTRDLQVEGQAAKRQQREDERREKRRRREEAASQPVAAGGRGG